jgi:hypothetical protein
MVFKGSISVNLSCANGARFESILRVPDPQNGFHAPKTHSGLAIVSIAP